MKPSSRFRRGLNYFLPPFVGFMVLTLFLLFLIYGEMPELWDGKIPGLSTRESEFFLVSLFFSPAVIFVIMLTVNTFKTHCEIEDPEYKMPNEIYRSLIIIGTVFCYVFLYGILR
jgi:hypothetical protein